MPKFLQHMLHKVSCVYQVILLPFLFVGFFKSASAAGIDGEWRVIFNCREATGVFAKYCKEGRRDMFYLKVWSSKSRVCETHLATAYFGNKVDQAGVEPTITGLKTSPVSTVQFLSSWGGHGVTTLEIVQGKLRWNVLSEEGASWMPARVREHVGLQANIYLLKQLLIA